MVELNLFSLALVQGLCMAMGVQSLAVCRGIRSHKIVLVPVYSQHGNFNESFISSSQIVSAPEYHLSGPSRINALNALSYRPDLWKRSSRLCLRSHSNTTTDEL